MRLSPFALLACVSALARAQSLDKDAVPNKENTVFNGISVPPLLELTPATFDAELKRSKFMMVKHYSPYCHHCADFAPVFQTAYEFYYTSHPEDAPDASFMEYYDFRFAMVNCVAYYDLCVENGVSTYPFTALYENGESIGAIRASKSIDVVSELIEQALEKAKPGSRPREVNLPEPGDNEFPKGAAEVAEAKADDAAAEDKKADKGSKPDPLYSDDSEQQQLGDDGMPVDEPAAKDRDSGDKKSGKAAGKTDRDSKKDTDSDKAAGNKKDKPPKRVSGKDWKAPTSAEIYNQRKQKKPTTTPNKNGANIALTAESFEIMVTKTQDPWFIKFYAPWCSHCQAMAPTWDQLAKNYQGKLNIGEVNCDKESRLCKEVGARGYPTLLFFKGGERTEYVGARGLGDLTHYADSALDLAAGVPDVDAAEFEALEKKEEVIFVYFYDHATTTEDFLALERLSLSLIGRAKLVKTNDEALYDRFKIHNFPRLLVSREGRPTYYTPLTPNQMRDVNGVLDWMKSVWLPLVPELTVSNAREIMDGRTVVLAVINREGGDAFQSAIREMKAAANEWMDRQVTEFQLERKKLRDAKQMRVEEARDRNDERALNDAKGIRIDMNEVARQEVGFAWVDGVFWQRWIRGTYGVDVSDGERVIITDHDAYTYWDQTATGNYIMVSRTAISESLDKIVYGPNPIPARLTISRISKLFRDLGSSFVRHPFLGVGVIIGILVLAYAGFRRRRAHRLRLGGGQFRMEETMGSLGSFKDGLLGQPTAGYAKAD